MNTAISVKQLSVAYSNIEAINNINLDIKKGEFISIIGPNGGGKTTLLNTILGFLEPVYGNVQILGEPLKRNRSIMSYVPQIAAIDRNFPINVLETVMTAFLKIGLHPLKRFSLSEKQSALSVLGQVGLGGFETRKISELSGGEFQRLLIARALAAKPQILLLDEPTANVDAASRNKIFELLSELNRNGMTIVIVTHDLAAATKFSSRLVCINRQLIYCGEPSITDEINQIMYGTRV